MLTKTDKDLLLSLNDSELLTFLQSADEETQRSILSQLAGPGEVVTGDGVDFVMARNAKRAAEINEKTAQGQEIGPLPAIADPDRRKRCEFDNLLFAETYFKPTFYLPWAPFQLAMMKDFQAVILEGGRECDAVRRGGLKSTCARVSNIWAVLNGHRRFAVLVGATDDKANEHRTNFFKLLASSALLVADFPELTPLLLKWKQPKKSFRLNGRLLEMHPKNERGWIVFPDIYDSPSCQIHVAPYSLMATDAAGLSYVDRDGVTVRPDLITFDDVQTPQSAGSPLQTEEREDRITKTFLGLGGIGQKLAAIMVCTVRAADDLSERFLNRKRHPDWNGKKYASLLRLPERMDLWEKYAGLLREGGNAEEGKRMATAFYSSLRQVMDAGGEVAWEEDKYQDELSALQSMMTIRALDREFFDCEIQQEGVKQVNTTGVALDAQSIVTRLSRVERGIVPKQASYLTAFVDSSDEVLWWMVCGWGKDFSGWIVDYGTWPNQGRAVFYKSDLVRTISQVMPEASWEEAFVNAHNTLDHFLCNEWVTENGLARNIDLILKDWSDGEHKPRITSQLMASPERNRIRPSKGFAPRPGKKPVHDYGDKHRDRNSGMHWVERRSETPINVQYNTNIWKSHAARRLLTTVAAPSSVLLPGHDENAHRLLAEHFTAEKPKQMIYDNTPGIVWELSPGRDNDWFDCYVGNCVAASILGCGLLGEQPAKKELRTFQLPGGAKRG